MPRFDRCVNCTHQFTLWACRRIVRLLLPDQCPGCGTAETEGGYCTDCAAGLLRHPRQCRECGVPLGAGEVCGRCQRSPSPFIETIAPFQYAAPVSDDIHRLKYRRQLARGRDLGLLLARELTARARLLPDVLVPVPLHWKRRFRRGFNQSVEIARPVSRAFGIPIDATLVSRCVHTPPQVGLTPAQRRRNMRRAFIALPGPAPGTVAIVDDVITSGSTVREVARCLHDAGARQVLVWALARA